MAVDAWYLVKFGGTAIGDAGRVTVKPTGGFGALAVSAYYNCITDALAATTPPTKDSFGLVSHLHDYTALSTLAYGVIKGPYYPMFISVNDADMTASLVGATERTDNNNDLTFSSADKVLHLYGINLHVGDDINMPSANGYLKMEKGTVNFQGINDKFSITGDGGCLEMVDMDIIYPSGSPAHVIQMTGGGVCRMTGGSVQTPANNIALFLAAGGGNGGFTLEVNGMDLSSIEDWLVSGLGASVADDTIRVEINGCILSSTVAYQQEQFIRPNQSTHITNCSSVAGSAEYADSLYNWVGSIVDQDSLGIVRSEAVTFESGEQTSRKVTTTADCSISHPMTIALDSRFAKLSTAEEDTLTVNLAVIDSVTLTDANCYLRVQYPTEAAKNLWATVETRNADILAAGIELSADLGVWENNSVALTGYNKYKIEVPITGGADCYPIVELILAEPNIAGTLYVSRVIGVS